MFFLDLQKLIYPPTERERERDRVDMNREFSCHVCVLEDRVLWGNH